MISINQIKEIILERQKQMIPKDLIPRDIKISKEFINLDLAKIIMGPRRAGKTYFLFQIIQMLKRSKEEYVYLNFEDNRLIDFTYLDFEKILDAYYQLYPNKKPILFFDEIHNVPKWEYFVRRLVDQKYNVFITGSNSQLLSGEYATKIAGRYISIFVYPLSFKEFLKFKNFKLTKQTIFTKKYQIINYFQEYLFFGGFPGVAKQNQMDIKKQILSDYLTSVIYRDLISRYKINEEKTLELIIKKIAENITNPYSFSSIAKALNNIGYDIGVKTISTYYEYLKKIFLVLHSSFYRNSVVKKEMERKTYLIDNGYLSLFFTKHNEDKLLENLVATELFKEDHTLNYIRNKYEIDFVSNKHPLMVSYDLSNPATKEREIKGLLEAMEFFKLKEGLLLTYDQEAELIVKDRKGEKRKIIIKPVWKWLLE